MSDEEARGKIQFIAASINPYVKFNSIPFNLDFDEFVVDQVQVEIAISQGKEKGPVIAEEAKRQNVSLLVLGQRKKSILWRLMRRWASKKKAVTDIVDYCIQNSSCMTIAVRRKGSKLGGYLITTKRHKNFWLLA